MAAFRELVVGWQGSVFPKGSPDEELDEIHADLALCDSWIAESLLPYLRTGKWVPAIPDVLQVLDDIVDRLNRQQEQRNDLVLIDQYTQYASLLRAVYKGFLDRRRGGFLPGLGVSGEVM